MPSTLPLASHAVLLLLVQLALLVVLARIGGELARRLGLPSVVGELLGGIALGPSGFGHFLPGLQLAIFPPESEQFHLLEVVSNLGMIFLLVLTGYETDVRLLKNLGRSAVGASGFGMVVPFVFGLILGFLTPAQYLADPSRRLLFSLFLATALSISAMPVIARILSDLDLTRRNIGIVILSAGVVDDTTGWLVLSVIAGAARASGLASLSRAVSAVLLTGVFLLACWFVFYPVLKRLGGFVRDRFRSPHTDLVLVLVVTLLFSAATDAIGVHAVFGAFIAGALLRQVPRLDEASVAPLEAMVSTLFAPVFFGVVGLKVDVWPVAGHAMLWIVLGVATLGKLAGVTAGSLLGGLSRWEALSIAVAMNARGAMELVVATIGLSLGILNRDMYSIIVVIAVATSFMAPLLLRFTTRFVTLTDDEKQRLAEAAARGFFTADRLRVLLPTSGGPNTMAAAALGLGLADPAGGAVVVLRVNVRRGLRDSVRAFLRRREDHADFDATMARVSAAAKAMGAPAPEVHSAAAGDVARAIATEGRRGYGLVVLGGSSRGSPFTEVMASLVADAPCHVAVVASRGEPRERYVNVLVPVDGSAPSRAAAELAAIYARRTGARVTVVRYEERRPDLPGGQPPQAPGHHEMLDRIAPALRAMNVNVEVIEKEAAGVETVLDELARGGHDLLLLGAENRALQRKLFLGWDTEQLVNASPISVAILVPKPEGRAR